MPGAPLVSSWTLYAAISGCGAATMALEVLGARLLTPVYGASLVVWAALISVTLTALAVGYVIGGRIADRPRPAFVFAPLIAAGTWVASIELLRYPVLVLVEPLGLHAAAIGAATLLFAPPLVAIATLGPIAIRLLAVEQAAVGRVTGWALAWSTAGSVAGTLLTAFVFVPFVGTPAALLLVAGGLALAGAGLWWRVGRRRDWGPVVTALGLVLAATLLAGRPAEPAGYRVREVRESLYGRLRVLDDSANGLRWLVADASVIGARFATSDAPVFPYLKLAAALTDREELLPPAGRVLVIGLGAGFLPRRLADRGHAVEVIELDAGVVHLATRHFGFDPSALTVVRVGDARRELRSLSGQYDLVVHDCFTGGTNPAHLLTVEALGELAARIRSGGSLVINVFAEPGGAAVSAAAATIAAVFPNAQLFVIGRGRPLADHVFVVTPRALTLSNDDLAAFDAERATMSVTASPVTDAANPLELLQVKAAARYRELLVVRLGREAVLR